MDEAINHRAKSLKTLELLELQVRTRRQLVADMNAELAVINQRVENNALIVDMLQSDLVQMKEEYAAMIRLAQVNSNAYDALVFLFSADNVTQAYRRWLYLRQYAQYRSKQLVTINAVSAKMQLNLSQLQEQQQAKETLLQEKQQELESLSKQEQQLDAVLKSFGLRQSELRQKVALQQQEEAALSEQIGQLLAGQAKKNLAGNAQAYASFDKLSQSFLAQKGNLPSPLKTAVISEKFGAHAHPVLPNVRVYSNGIAMTTSAGAHPIAIFNGIVTKVFEVSPGVRAVILRHGTYLSVYINLSEVYVHIDDEVKSGQELGELSAQSGFSVLKFQVWKENTKLDPEQWITPLMR